MPEAQPRHAHETSDANIRNLIIFGVCVALMVIGGLVVSRGIFHYFTGHQGLGPPASPFENVRMLPTGPRLQIKAPQDLERYKAAQEEVLNGYGWVDRKAGIARIPIDRAMDILLQKGFPVRGASWPKPSAPKTSDQNRDVGKGSSN
jgi:hypothetical protein